MFRNRIIPIYGQSIFKQVLKVIQRGEGKSYRQIALKELCTSLGKVNSELHLIPYPKIITKWVINPNVKAVTVKLVEENIEYFHGPHGGRFLRS